jgi:hypothetical protein
MGGSASLCGGDADGAVEEAARETVVTVRPSGWADSPAALSRGGGSTITAIHFLLARGRTDMATQQRVTEFAGSTADL